MRTLCILLAISVAAFGYPAHPRLWTSQLTYLATVAANPSSPDYAAYQAMITEANTFVPCFGTPTAGCGTRVGVMSITITAATHGNPTLLTVAETINSNYSDPDFTVAGIGTPGDCWNGNGATPTSVNQINGQLGNGTTTPLLVYQSVTYVSAHVLSVAFDSSACSDWSGTAYGLDTVETGYNNIIYAYAGEGWIEAAMDLGEAYQLTSYTPYATAGRQLLDYINNLVSVGNYGVVSNNGGYPTRNVWYAISVLYDYLYPTLTSGEKTATIATVKGFYNNMWLVAQGLAYGNPWALIQVTDCGTGSPVKCPTNGYSFYAATDFEENCSDSNYWGGNVTGLGYMGMAIAGDDAAGATIMADADAQFDGQLATGFSTTPGNVGSIASGLSQEFYGYGNRNMARFVQYMMARNGVEGTSLFTTTTYAQRMATAAMYGLHPNGWQGTPEWQATTDGCVGVFDMSLPQVPSVALAGTTPGAHMQYEWTTVSQSLPIAIANACSSDQNFYLFRGLGEKLLWTNTDTNTSTSYYSLPTNLPAQPGDGHAYYRSAWGSSGVWSSMRSSSIQWGPHNTTAAGNIEIQRGSDYVLPNAQEWRGRLGYALESPSYMVGNGAAATQLASGYFNTLFFFNNGENQVGFGSPCFPNNTNYYGCQDNLADYNGTEPITTANANYVYSGGNLSPAYHGYNAYTKPHPLDSYVSMLYYFRDYVAAGDGTFVVWDRAQSTKAMNDGSNYVGNIRWHLPVTTPTISGNTASAVVGSSKIYVSSFLPSGSTPTITPCEVDLYSLMQAYGSGGPWPCTGAGVSGSTLLDHISRIEVSDPTPSTNLNVMTVIYTTTSAGSQPTTTKLSTIDGSHIGVLVADTTPKVVVFGKGVTGTSSYPNYASTQYNNVTYTANYSGTAHHVVANMLPSASYTVTRGGTGIASGTTGADGTVYFTDSIGGNFVVNQGTPTLVITTSSLPSGVIGSAYSATISALYGTTPYTWSVTSGTLCSGLSLGLSTGTISGTPTGSPTTCSFTVQVQDSATPTPATYSQGFSITVNDAGSCTITTNSLLNGTVGTPYSQTLATLYCTSPLTWSLASGTMCAGVSLGSSSGTISGTPTTAQTCSFVAQVVDSEGTPEKANQALSITITGGAPASGGAFSISAATIKH